MAIYFVHHKAPKFIFLCNYKVMYSSLYEMLPAHFPDIERKNKTEASKINFHHFPKFLIVRNPYSRAVSTYFGKCQKAPEIYLQQENAYLEFCQYQLLDALQQVRNQQFQIVAPGIKYNEVENPKERMTLNKNLEVLRSMDFEEFTICLDYLLQRKNADAHFLEQYQVFSIARQNPFYFKSKLFKNTTALKLENIDKDWKLFCQKLGKDMALLKTNVTDHLRPAFKTFYTTSSQALIAKLYKNDFKKFAYSQNL